MVDEEDWFALAMGQMRGSNDYWYWRDKPEMEVGAARAVLTQAGLEIQQLRSRDDGEDPPDCEAIIGGSRCGIEVTELVHQPTLESTIRGNHQILFWERDTFCTALQERIDRKDRSDKVKGGPYDRYILVVVTDEFSLGREDVAQFLEGATFRSRFITDVYLGLSYDPEPRLCPVFELTLVPR
jgi:hypothetical protein